MLIEGPPGPEGPAVSIDSHSLIYFQQSYTFLQRFWWLALFVKLYVKDWEKKSVIKMFDFTFPSFLRVPLVPLALLDPLVPLATQARGLVLHQNFSERFLHVYISQLWVIFWVAIGLHQRRINIYNWPFQMTLTFLFPSCRDLLVSQVCLELMEFLDLLEPQSCCL